MMPKIFDTPILTRIYEWSDTDIDIDTGKPCLNMCNIDKQMHSLGETIIYQLKGAATGRPN